MKEDSSLEDGVWGGGSPPGTGLPSLRGAMAFEHIFQQTGDGFSSHPQPENYVHQRAFYVSAHSFSKPLLILFHIIVYST